MVAFEDTEGNKLALSVYFSNGYDRCVNIFGSEDCIFNFTKLYAEAVKLDLIILSAEASAEELVDGLLIWWICLLEASIICPSCEISRPI